MKFLKLHFIELTIAVLLVVVGFFFFQDGAGGTKAAGSMAYNQNWICIAQGESIEYGFLPERIGVSKGDGQIILRKKLEQEILPVNVIGFFTSHQEVAAFVDGKQIYRKETDRRLRSKTPGNCWNFIQLEEKYGGKDLEIHIRNCYDHGNVKIPEFFYGPQSSIVVQQLNTKMFALMVGISMLMVGLMLLISWGTIGKRMHFHKGILWLGLFTIQFAVWSTMETQIPALMLGRELLCAQITFMSLKLSVLPIVCFIQVVYKGKGGRLWSVLAWLGILDFAVSFISQIFGWYDYRQTVWFTHLLGVFVILAALWHGMQILLEKRKRIFARENKMYQNMAAICFVGGCVLLDAFNYYYRFYEDVATFSRIGCLAFVLILTVRFFEDSIDLIEAGKQAETIKVEAERDGLTIFKNRRTFEMDLSRISEGELNKYAIVMFDLNHLKRMNDVYGHHMGDYYIITGSEIVQDVFGEFGEIYRVGGDEFCLVSDCMSEQDYRQKAADMCSWMESLKGIPVEDRGIMQIASGFAMFHQNVDRTLQDTIERADKEMYQCKKEQKAQKI